MAANRFSADVSAATFVRGVTISTRCGRVGGAERCRSNPTRMRCSIARAAGGGARGHFGQFARRGGRQAMFSRAGLDGQGQSPAPSEEQALAFVGAEQIL